MDWEDLLRRHGPALVLYARQWLESAAEAEEAVQIALVRGWRVEASRKASCSLPLLYTLVRCAAIDLGRSRERRRRREEDALAQETGDGVGWFEDPVDRQERQAAVRKALRGLPVEQREVIVLRMWAELSFREIGEALGIPLNTAASRYRYAIEALKRRLDGDWR